MKRYDLDSFDCIVERADGPLCQYADVAPLVERLAAAEADAERYRWLRDNCRPEYSDIETPHAVVKVCVGDFRNGTGWFDIIGSKAKVGIVTLDQAVDAARNPTKEG